MDSSRLTFKPKIIIIGGGNVATHFTCAFSQTEASIIALAPGCRQSVADLSSNYGINCIQQVEDIPSDVDAVIIATNDSATAEVANLLPQIRGVVIHTSGSVPLSVLSTKHNRAGVLYPLQTFSKNVAVDIKEVPFFIEATDDFSEIFIRQLASLISNHIYSADSAQRKHLHIAGVLTSNFPIFLMQIAQRTLADAGFPLEVVQPLMKASIAKAFSIGPHEALTGPARRGDKATILAHQAMLPEYAANIYQIISNAILNEYHPL